MDVYNPSHRFYHHSQLRDRNAIDWVCIFHLQHTQNDLQDMFAYLPKEDEESRNLYLVRKILKFCVKMGTKKHDSEISTLRPFKNMFYPACD